MLGHMTPRGGDLRGSAATTVLVRVMCNRPRNAHTVATVVPTAHAEPLVHFVQTVRGIDGEHGADWTLPLSGLTGHYAFCASCHKTYPMNRYDLLDAIRERRTRLVLQPLGFHLDPMRVLQLRDGGQR